MSELVSSRPAESPGFRAICVRVGYTAFVLFPHALVLATPFVGLSRRLLALTLAGYALQLFGITGGYHRGFSHRAFKTTRVFQFILAWLGCTAMHNGPLWWVSSHRRHHRHSDHEGDPHSPVFGGLWHSYLGWVLDGKCDTPDLGNVKDLARYPELRFIDRYKWVPTMVWAAACLAIGGLPGLVWVGGVATVMAFHAPLLVNSVAHTWGRRRFETSDASRNNTVLGVLTLGEGWHNNHHHDPRLARHGLAWWEIDVTYYALWLLSVLGVVWDLQRRRRGDRAT